MGPMKDSIDTVNQDYDICVLGAEGSGKSAFIMQYIYHRFMPDTDSQLEEIHTKVIRNGSNYNEITILDACSHQDNYASSRKRQLLNNSGMIFAYSITSVETFYAIQDLYERVSEYREDMPPVVVVGLKSDLESERIVSCEEGEAFANSIGAIGFFECTAALRVNVDEAFNPLVSIIIDKNQMQRRASHSKTIDITSMQSLREVLSSPSPASISEQNDSPAFSMITSKKVDYDSMEDLEIPKLAGNEFASKAAAQAPKLVENINPIHGSNPKSSSATPVNTASSNKHHPHPPSAATSTSAPRKYTKDDVEELQNKVKNHKSKSKSGCCVIT